MNKILLLSDASNVHTQKWAKYFRDKDFEVHIISLLPASIDGVKVHMIKSKAYSNRINNMKYDKFRVLMDAVPQVKKAIKSIKPDIVHAHFASSYGLFGALSGFHPFLLSVWGYDTIRFPEISFIHRNIIKLALKKADRIFATSNFLAEKTARYTDKSIVITPFGVNTELFSPKPKEINEKFIFGTVKALEDNYGIDCLIEAASKLRDEFDNWELWIVGTGTKEKELKKLAKDKGIGDKTVFWGKVKNSEVPEIVKNIDVFTITSLVYESFGVAAVEASAMGIPVIASRLGGLTEVVIENKTGLHIDPGNSRELADKLIYLYKNPDIRKKLGRNGRIDVENKYNWIDNAGIMLKEYLRIIRERN